MSKSTTYEFSFPITGGTAVSNDTLSASLHSSMPSGEQARRIAIQLLAGIIAHYNIVSNTPGITSQPSP